MHFKFHPTIEALRAHKKKYTFLTPSIKSKSLSKKPTPLSPVKEKTPTLKEKPVETKEKQPQERKTAPTLDHLESLIKDVDQQYETFSQDQTVQRKKVKLDLPKTPTLEKLKGAIAAKLGIIVERDEDLVLTSKPIENGQEKGVFSFHANAIYIQDMALLEIPENKKQLWALLCQLL